MKYIIGLPFSPSKRESTSTQSGYHIKVTYGGGMGGSSVDYYALSYHTNAADNLLVKLSGIHEDSEIILNPRFVVSIRKVLIVKQVITNVGNSSMKEGNTTEYYVFPDHTDVWFSDSHGTEQYLIRSDKWKNKDK